MSQIQLLCCLRSPCRHSSRSGENSEPLLTGCGLYNTTKEVFHVRWCASPTFLLAQRVRSSTFSTSKPYDTGFVADGTFLCTKLLALPMIICYASATTQLASPKPCIYYNMQIPRWQGIQDLNLYCRSQSAVCCRYTNSLYVGQIAPPRLYSTVSLQNALLLRDCLARLFMNTLCPSAQISLVQG